VTALDKTYQDSRSRMISKAAEVAAKTWDPNDRDSVKRVVAIVEGGMAQVANLVSAFFTQKARAHTGNAQLPMLTVPAREMKVEAVRGVKAAEVYERPYGAIGVALANGEDFDAATVSARDYVKKLALTDLQLAQTHAAKKWMELANG
jgi:hypothetical protein